MDITIRGGKRMYVGLFLVAVILLASRAVGAQQFTAAPPPQPGKALVYVYREASMVGKAGYSRIYVNTDFLATLHSGEYALREVPAGTVVFTTLPRALPITALGMLTDEQKKKHEKLRLDAETGKTYYFRWSVGDKMKLVDKATGVKEIRKTHLAKDLE